MSRRLIPRWAEKLTLDALVYLEDLGYKVPTPAIIWRHGQQQFSSGRTYLPDKIIITAGKNRLDTKLVLLHELAHTVAGNKPVYLDVKRATKQGWRFLQEPTEPLIIGTRSHTSEFWDIAWKLYRWAKLPIRYCQQREYIYRKGAISAYRRNIKTRDRHEGG